MMHLTSQPRLLISGMVQDVRPPRIASLRATTVTFVSNANTLYANKQRGLWVKFKICGPKPGTSLRFRWTEYSDEISPLVVGRKYRCGLSILTGFPKQAL